MSSLLLAASIAWADGCCAPASSAVPDVLGPSEALGAGLGVGAGATLANWTWDGRVVGVAGSQRTAVASVFGQGRLGPRAQLGFSVPWRGNYEHIDGKTTTGGGAGDLGLAARWDAEPIHCGEWHFGPRPAMTLGVTLPTGRSWERVGPRDGAQVTGLGTVQPTASLTWEGSHPHGSFSGFVAAGWPIGTPATVSLGATLGWQLDRVSLRGLARVELGGTANAPARQPRAGLGVVWQASDRARATLGLDAALPVPSLGQNRPVDVQLSAAILMTAPT